MRSVRLKKILAWLLVLGTAASFAACGTESDGAKKGLVISEVVSSNGKSYEHDYYGSPDWIELHNESDQPINLLGWGITELIFTFVNEFLTSFGMGVDFRYSYEFLFVGLFVCILISAASAISSTYLPFAEWKKERDRTAKRHLGE